MLHRLLSAVRVRSSPHTPATGGLLPDLLRDPTGSWHALLTHLRDTLTTWGPTTAASLAAGALVLRLGRTWQQQRAHRRLARGAQIITVLPPPNASPDDAPALWAHLAGLLLPARRRPCARRATVCTTACGESPPVRGWSLRQGRPQVAVPVVPTRAGVVPTSRWASGWSPRRRR